MAYSATLLLVAYLALAFASSAAVVRLRPHSRVARRLRLDLAMFPFLPIMLLIAVLRAGQHSFARLGTRFAGLFVRLSGRQQYKRYPYAYHAYPRDKTRRRAAGR